jgi:alanyl-tRNA synthetase
VTIKRSDAIREAFLSYFEKQGHTRVDSSSLVPTNDPSLLFTNAGMVQFKNLFLGQEQAPYTRATSSQRCVRAGGKHNDLANVGHTARHHTFFEMLGNFSFGDYFKREAIHYAWDFLTKELGIPVKKLWITVYEEDDEAAEIWRNDIGLTPDRIIRCGEADNFWSMGDTGPCGPCTEIFYDHGDAIPGGLPGTPDQEGDRYVEIWNLVFMQYNRDDQGKLTSLPKPSVDTGMGLERIAAVMQGVHDNHDIDLFQHLIKSMAALVKPAKFDDVSLRVIADHLRSAAFLMLDGVVPGSEGRGYVLRRIMRRAMRYAYQQGYQDSFFPALLPELIVIMGAAYPQLVTQQAHISKLMAKEEAQFSATLKSGMGVLAQALKNTSGKVLSGEVAFELYDTYGFPLDLTQDMVQEHGMSVDIPGFEQKMQAQQARSRQGKKFKAFVADCTSTAVSDFIGYHALLAKGKVLELWQDGKQVDRLHDHGAGCVILDQTAFYPEGGGQVGDKGLLESSQGVFTVLDTRKQAGCIMHYGHMLEGEFTVGVGIEGKVDPQRHATMLNHSATHLLHAVLREQLGDTVIQKGSLVDEKHFRFDFSYDQPLTPEQIKAAEDRVNELIRENLPAKTEVMDLDQAKKLGAMALFGEKYGKQVRVCSMGDVSVELCGGTHVACSGQIGAFVIVGQSGIAAGVRRVEALTGQAALDYYAAYRDQVQQVAQVLKVQPEQLLGKAQQLMDGYQDLKSKQKQVQQRSAHRAGGDLAASFKPVADFQLLCAKVEVDDVGVLRSQVDVLKLKHERAVVALAAEVSGRLMLVVSVAKGLQGQVKAPDVLAKITEVVGGKGGGRPDFAQGIGEKVDKLSQAWDELAHWLALQEA